MNPLVSIVIPVFNSRAFIEEAVEAWLAQTYPHLEIILQDDCSTDGTWEFLMHKYQQNSLVVLNRNSSNQGIGKNWNTAYQAAKGDFVVIFNSDDFVEPTFLENAFTVFEDHKNLDFVSAGYYTTGEEDKKEVVREHLSVHEGFINHILTANQTLPVKLHWNYTLIKKQALEELKVKDNLFYNTQVCDAMLWCEAYRKHKKGYFSGKLSGYYRIHDSNNSKIPLGEFESTMLDMLPNYYRELREIHPSNYLSPLKSTLNYVYQCLKYKKKLKFRVIKNILRYGYKK